MYWLEIKTPAHPRHCQALSEVKSQHFSPTVSPLSPALGEKGIQMTGELDLMSMFGCIDSRSLCSYFAFMDSDWWLKEFAYTRDLIGGHPRYYLLICISPLPTPFLRQVRTCPVLSYSTKPYTVDFHHDHI